jgi:uncharacterized delta-60 repeat protein
LAIQADGKIVVAGYYRTDNSDDDFIVVRYNSNGTLDHSFSGDGKARIDFGGYDEAYAVAVQPDGKIVVAGYSDNSLPGMKVARLNSSGTPDNTFGNNGKTTIEFGGNGFAQSVAVQPNGYMVVAGSSNSIFGIHIIAITKLGPLGHRVSNFGVSGRVTTLIGSSSVGNSVIIQPDKKIIVAGNTWHGNSNYDFALVRYNSDGSPDNSFGTNGITTTDFGSDDDFGNSVVLQPDGKIVVAGESSGKIAVARYNGDPVSQTASSENISAASDKKLSSPSAIKLFPNPAKDLLSIEGMDASSAKTIFYC